MIGLNGLGWFGLGVLVACGVIAAVLRTIIEPEEHGE